MTKLPVEAEAIAFAQDWIRQHREPKGVFHPDSEKLFGKSLMKWFVQVHPFGAVDIVYFAENGSHEAKRALDELIAEHLDKYEVVPAVLAAYEIRLKRGGGEGKPGPAKTDNFVRDIGITLLVDELVKRFPKLGFHQNPGSHLPTITSIAAKTLSEAGIGIVFGPKAVAKIWGKYQPILSGNFPAGYLGPFG
jgi:hypothetical protein